MKNLVLVVFLVLLIFACRKSFEPVEEPFDQDIVGDWISSYEKPPFPFPAISGIQIQSNGDAYPLSIEIETGELIKSSDRIIAKYLSANNGVLIYKSFPIGLALASNYKRYYKIKDDTLFLSFIYEESFSIKKPQYSSFRVKSKVGTQITQPVHTIFEAILDSIQSYNIPINRYPSAYAYLENSKLIMKAEINNCGYLNFEISNFNGIGIYDKSTSYASFAQGCGDALAFSDTDYDSSSIFIMEIFAFDSTQISGNFELKVEPYHFENGNFLIPVY